MLKYLVIQLDDTSTSFCHYAITLREPRLIPIDTLRRAIRWAMTENMTIQFVYPEHALPAEYDEAIETIDHAKIKPATAKRLDDADVIVFNSIGACNGFEIKEGVTYVVRTRKSELFEHYNRLQPILEKAKRLNVVITDLHLFKDDEFSTYESVLSSLSESVKRLYVDGHPIQFNLLTDRMMLTEMNNCGAGDGTITMAPDGQFYVCPAFYYEGATGYSIGNIEGGLDIKNSQLYKLKYAPICRTCDAFHCHRCVWLNRRTTLEVNTPSHEQCVVAHIERNASRRLLESIREVGEFLPDMEIPEIDYFDPFENVRIDRSKTK